MKKLDFSAHFGEGATDPDRGNEEIKLIQASEEDISPKFSGLSELSQQRKFMRGVSSPTSNRSSLTTNTNQGRHQSSNSSWNMYKEPIYLSPAEIRRKRNIRLFKTDFPEF